MRGRNRKREGVPNCFYNTGPSTSLRFGYQQEWKNREDAPIILNSHLCGSKFDRKCSTFPELEVHLFAHLKKQISSKCIRLCPNFTPALTFKEHNLRGKQRLSIRERKTKCVPSNNPVFGK